MFSITSGLLTLCQIFTNVNTFLTSALEVRSHILQKQFKKLESFTKGWSCASQIVQIAKMCQWNKSLIPNTRAHGVHLFNLAMHGMVAKIPWEKNSAYPIIYLYKYSHTLDLFYSFESLINHINRPLHEQHIEQQILQVFRDRLEWSNEWSLERTGFEVVELSFYILWSYPFMRDKRSLLGGAISFIF